MSDTFRMDSPTSSIVIRLKQPSSDEVKFQVLLSSTVDQLLLKIRHEISDSSDKNIRLIYMGKPLIPTINTLGSFGIVNNAVIHCFVSPHREIALSNPAPSQILNLLSNDDNNGDNLDARDHNNYRGFDRLLTVLNVDEVAAIRTSFRPDVDALAERRDRNDNEAAESYRFRMEEEWMSMQGPNSEYAQNLALTIRNNMINDGSSSGLSLNSNNGFAPIFGGRMSSGIFGINSSHQDGGLQEFLSGFFIGFVLGFIVLFCVWDRNISHRHRLGLLSGVLLSLSLDLNRERRSSNTATSTDNHHRPSSNDSNDSNDTQH